MSKVLLLTGPPGAGKSTIADLVAKNRPRCVTVDVDLLRYDMVRPFRPAEAPWEKEGKLAYPLSAENACLIAENLIKHKFDVLLLDILIDQNQNTYQLWKNKLDIQTILLLPSWSEIKKRTTKRSSDMKVDRIKWLYESHEKLKAYDVKIDNTKLSAEEVAGRLSELLR